MRWDGLAATGNSKKHFQRHVKIGKQDDFSCSGLLDCFLCSSNQIMTILKPNSASIKPHNYEAGH